MRNPARHLGAALTAVGLVACLVVPALGKESLLATLDAPIAMDTPPGTEILVGVTVVVPTEDGTLSGVDGSPIQLILTGRDGSTTRAAGAADGEPGHYVMRIVIPAGGARGLEVVMHGTSDLPITLTADPFTPGGVTARTAQLAPPLTPRLTPAPRPSAVAVAPLPAAQATAPASAPASPAPAMVLGLLAAVGVVAVGVGAFVRRARAARRAQETSRVSGSGA